MVGQHITYNCNITPKPYIHLLSCRRIEYPLSTFIPIFVGIPVNKFGPSSGVTVFLAELIRDFVLGLEMENVNRENNLTEERVPLSCKMGLKMAVVVIKYDIWKVFMLWVYRFQEILKFTISR